ncbi:glycosylase [Actinocorallia longicatena]|uniref:Glycoside hydrolase family 130 protein n=1 Tax=Actinocorallia longicatena TaxID=111803 RepID=A0ABP6QL94_9ACTN
MIARLFLPAGESRVAQILDRVLGLAEAEVERLATELTAEFGNRHPDYERLLGRHAEAVLAQIGARAGLTPARRLVLGAAFTAEYATEAAALCNPSAMTHPDQSGLAPGQVRVAVSVRGIGEGHISSIGFVSAVIGPGPSWSFEPRGLPLSAGVAAPARWRREHLRSLLDDQGIIDELGETILGGLPDLFGGADLERALAEIGPSVLDRSAPTVVLLRLLVSSAYMVEFGDETGLTQRVLMPSATEEAHGMEDARFTRFTDAAGRIEYRATYTAYDGRRIAPRLLISADLRTFRTHRLAGDAARNKGMALFPRLVGGRHLALCRSDGENTGVSSSADGMVWNEPVIVQGPRESWELMQIGNCGPPIETERGWLVLTHGVGPMRVYRMGAILLDLDDPTRLLARLERPLLAPVPADRNGYVPNVVYSCGAFPYEGRLWLPFGIADTRIGVAWLSIDETLDAMVP